MDVVRHGFIYSIGAAVILVVCVAVSRDQLWRNDVFVREPFTQRRFVIDPKTYTFLKDGRPFQYISGSIHYNRIPRYYWLDRLQKVKAAGLDAVQLYVPWNYHEMEEGVFNFTDNRDLEHFLDLVIQQDLLAIVRVGPYICAEWSFGGLPPWLLKKNPKMRIRSSDPEYFLAVQNWFNILLPRLRRYLFSRGGPIIMIQLENEYGSSSTCDRDYMSMLYDLARFHLGNDIILFTTDGNSVAMLKCGSPDQRYLATIDFGPDFAALIPPSLAFSPIEQFRPHQPLINSEFYTGWFDTWGDRHSRTNREILASSLIRLMKYSPRVNINMYMFHGGTTFELWNGNSAGKIVATTYDFDAPISEAGDITEKYEILRQTIHQFKQLPPPPLPSNGTKSSYGSIQMVKMSHLFHFLGSETQTQYPRNMEAFGQYEGFMLYDTSLPSNLQSTVNLKLQRFADVAHIFTTAGGLENLHSYGSLTTQHNQIVLDLDSQPRPNRLLLLLEITGRFNYGNDMWNDVKGLIGNVTIDQVTLTNWTVRPVTIPLKQSTHPMWSDAVQPVQGSVYTGMLNITSTTGPHDTFIQLDSFSRGIVIINGHILGRYDQESGPQLRLYVPQPFLRTGQNEITVVELRRLISEPTVVSFHAEPLWSS